LLLISVLYGSHSGRLGRHCSAIKSAGCLPAWDQGIRLCTIELNKNLNFAVVSRRPIGLDSLNDGRMLKKAVSQ
jgi:hypothetical protein